MFLQAGKGAENTKEKSRQCFPCKERNQIIANLMFTYCQVVALHTLWAWTRLMLYPTTSRTFNKNPPENINHFIIKQWWGVSLATLCKGS
jgi:hypothetical protein